MFYFRKLAWFLLVYTVFVMVWGGFVKASGSGDGCGESWPLCHGQVVPQTESASTWIELSHRLSTGLYGILVLAIWWWVRKASFIHRESYRWASLILALTVIESLIGAKLVLFGWVNQDASLARIVVGPLHLINTLLLLSATVGLLVSLYQPREELLREQFRRLIPFMLPIVLLFSTGALASMANLIFPSESLLEGFASDWSSESHILVRLRVLHPILAVLLIMSLLVSVGRSSGRHSLKLWCQGALILNFLIGATTLLTLSPLALKLTHLGVGHALWALLSGLAMSSRDIDATHNLQASGSCAKKI